MQGLDDDIEHSRAQQTERQITVLTGLLLMKTVNGLVLDIAVPTP